MAEGMPHQGSVVKLSSTVGTATTGGNESPVRGLNLSVPAGATNLVKGKRPNHLRLVR